MNYGRVPTDQNLWTGERDRSPTSILIYSIFARFSFRLEINCTFPIIAFRQNLIFLLNN